MEIKLIKLAIIIKLVLFGNFAFAQKGTKVAEVPSRTDNAKKFNLKPFV